MESVLEQIGANKVDLIQVMNKIDLTGSQPRVDTHSDGRVKRVWLSAATGEGVDLLKKALVDYFRNEMVSGEISLQPAQARIRALLFEMGAVQSETVDDHGCFHLNVCLAKRDLTQLAQREHMTMDDLLPITTG